MVALQFYKTTCKYATIYKVESKKLPWTLLDNEVCKKIIKSNLKEFLVKAWETIGAESQKKMKVPLPRHFETVIDATENQTKY